MVAADSADVWARQHLFRFDATVGMPPDAFSATGQDWGLPVYRWDVMERDDYRWLRQRAQAQRAAVTTATASITSSASTARSRAARQPTGSFDPPDEPAQLALGERLLRRFHDDGARIIAEDLGVVPDFVRRSLPSGRSRLQGAPLGARVEGARPAVPRSRRRTRHVGRDDRHARHRPDRPWWDAADADERASVRGSADPSARPSGRWPRSPFTPALRDAILRALYTPGPTCCSSRSGRLRVDRSHQHARDRQRRQLDVAAALAVDALGSDAGRRWTARIVCDASQTNPSRL